MQLLRVARHLKEELGVTKFDLEFLGEGPLEGPMKSYISRYGLEENVRLCGQVPHQVLLETLVSSDIFCFPSLHEACPIVLIEAMALGKPLVAFNYPFAREIVGKEFAELLASSTLDFARKIVYLMKNDGDRLKLGRTLYNHAAQFDSSNIAAEYQTAYQGLIR
jgi:glycosyltransferase involved in cell wall biosynthesis